LKKFAFAVALLGALISSAAHSRAQAKTFVGVLWPMFGPLPAIGLVELVAELKTLPDVEVKTYLHQEWPALVEDLGRQEPGTHTFVIGYSLGANATAFVANKSKYIDLIIALQPSMLSWNPPVTGKVGRMIEVYNPNPWMTFGGMGSKKLEGSNIEYIANNDSHPGAQFNFEFRDLVKRELANFAAEDRQDRQDHQETAQAAAPAPLAYAQLPRSTEPKASDAWLGRQANDAAAKDQRQMVQTEIPLPLPRPRPDHVARELPKPAPTAQAPGESVVFLDALSNSVNSGGLASGDLSAGDAPSGVLSVVKRELTPADMMDYARRTYGASHLAER
jgi:hypothetical protein